MPCAARRTPFALCCICFALLDVQRLVSNAQHGEYPICAIPAPHSVGSRQFCIFGQDVRCGQVRILTLSMRLGSILCRNTLLLFVLQEIHPTMVPRLLSFRIHSAVPYKLLSAPFRCGICRLYPSLTLSRRRIPCKRALKVTLHPSSVCF